MKKKKEEEIKKNILVAFIFPEDLSAMATAVLNMHETNYFDKMVSILSNNPSLITTSRWYQLCFQFTDLQTLKTGSGSSGNNYNSFICSIHLYFSLFQKL